MTEVQCVWVDIEGGGGGGSKGDSAELQLLPRVASVCIHPLFHGKIVSFFSFCIIILN